VVVGHDSREAVYELFSDAPHIIAGFSEFCYKLNDAPILFNADLLNWFIDILKRFETKTDLEEMSISEKFRIFAYQALADDSTFSNQPSSPLSQANELSG
jgi:hypothetical protein